MGVSKGEQFAQRDIYVDYPFEQVMFSCDHIAGKFFAASTGRSSLFVANGRDWIQCRCLARGIDAESQAD
ncbi:hypothetical protein [Dyella nitratireducens]|uniref:Uncharacterized protein n=1 Tax=Dyella nitratireducens TaxID=1849580 RepID=A0ABQ1FST6_9GAMM|nr:hypothetical protein GCM10010981_18310 [Dyella nitratireducens]GLQ43105.1 hypothetical protein GCM10007902_29550 [Dyella nitratireducens]